MIEMKLEGLSELKAQLEQLGAVTAAKVIAKAARKALAPVLEEMRARVPVDTGLLRDSLQVTAKKAPKDSEALVVVGIKVKVGKGGGIRDIAKAAADAKGRGDSAKTARRAAWRKSAHWRWHFVEFGTSKEAARPFIRPAFNKNAPHTLELLKDELAKEIQKALKKRGKKKGGRR